MNTKLYSSNRNKTNLVISAFFIDSILSFQREIALCMHGDEPRVDCVIGESIM